ncbi:MAG: glycosyltransferase family 39 protein [Lentisphaeria bacterium]|nr:glycosyltransferase family 39 protein [Lentisphaeria bacterium]
MFFPRYTPIPVRRRNEVVFWCFAVFMLLLFLGRNALWGMEGRCAEIVREMLVTGDIFKSQINSVAENSRLPLSYWFFLPTILLFGADEFMLRLPVVLAALVLLWATRKIAARLFDEGTALLSGWVLLSTYGFVFWARVAAPDMANAAASACAVACFLDLREDSGFREYFCFYFLLAAGAIFKGVPIVLMVCVLVLPQLFCYPGRYKKYINLRHAAALLAGAAAGLIPYWLCGAVEAGVFGKQAAGSGMEILWHNQILRILDATYSGEPVYSYLYHLPRILLPWSGVFIISCVVFIRERENLTPEFYALLKGMLLAFLLFSFSGSRRWYYLLPLVPFCSVVTAALLNGYAGEGKLVDWVLEIMYFILLIFASLALALPIALPLQGVIFRYHIPAVVIISSFIGGLLVVILLTFDRDEDNVVARFFAMPPRIASLTAGMAVSVTVLFCAVIPAFTVFRSEKPFALELKQLADGINPSKIFFFDNAVNARVLYYLAPARPVESGSDIAEFICRNSGGRVAVIAEDSTEAVEKLKNGLDTLTVMPFDITAPHIQELHLSHESAGKDKLRAWIFDVPANVTLKQKNTANNIKRGAKNE